MGFQKIPAGTRGRKPPKSNPFLRWTMRAMERYHRLRGNRFLGSDLLYLSTVGAKSGQRRRVPLARFPDGDGWLVVASLGGSVQHPGWYHNIAAHPDQVWAEVDGQTARVTAEQLEGDRRARAWAYVCAQQPRYLDYEQKTDRLIPVLKLTPVP